MNVLSIILLIALGVGGGLVLAKYFPRLIRFFKAFNTLLDEYKRFAIVFCSIVILGYFLLTYSVFYPPTFFGVDVREKVDSVISLWGQVVGLVFAIFVGYFAFRQAAENQFDKLKNVGIDLIKEKKYHSAQINWEKCISINSRDCGVYSNLLELYLIMGKTELFDEKIDRLKKSIREKGEQITYYYLVTCRAIFEEAAKKIRKEVVVLTKYLKDNPDALSTFGWNFDDVIASSIYQGLGPEAKDYYMLVKAILEANLSPEQQARIDEIK